MDKWVPFSTGLDLIISQCVREEKIYEILKAIQDEPCGGHFADKRMSHKILCMGNYWPNVL